MLITTLSQAFIPTTSGEQNSNNCEHIIQQNGEMIIFPILNILNLTMKGLIERSLD